MIHRVPRVPLITTPALRLPRGFLLSLGPLMLLTLLFFTPKRVLAEDLVLAPASPVAARTLRIGVIASLTGPAGEQGTNWLRGAELAAAELRTQGVDIELLVEDDQTSPARAVRAFQKIISTNSVQAILAGTWDYVGEPLYPLAARNRIPLITLTNPSEILSPAAQQNAYVFTAAMSLADIREALRSFLIAQQSKSVAIIVPSLPFGVVQADMVEAIARELEIPLALRFDFAPDGNVHDDIRIGASRIAKHKPDVVFAVVDYHLLALLTKEFERIRFMPQIVTTQHLDAALAISRSKSQFRSCFGIYPESILNENFRARFLQMFNNPARVFSAEGYDVVHFLASAFASEVNLAKPAVPFEYAGLAATFRVPPTSGRSISENRAVIMTTRNGSFERWLPPGTTSPISSSSAVHPETVDAGQ